jgi:hypothetical protein
VGSHVSASESNPINPYSPPQADMAPRAVRPRRAYLTWIYAGLSAVPFVAITATHLVEYSADTAWLWEAIQRSDVLLALVRSVIALLWIHATWKHVPLGTREELHVTPGKAVGFLFIPFVNIYWIVAMPRRLCTALDRVRIERGRPPSAPFAIALLASTLNLVHAVLSKATEGLPVLLSFTATSTLWFLFMLQCDRARADT